ncbi:hypothetical protein BDV96DRAFT_370897 [Lophiotrema nucula]|uniref:Uncharacterized protein n=1 Tax=Lophiotrema nucula TaxID=690887 RepID=A0A6A5ZJV3_9PLEO|nr:hypothetical protein BDV96DRAFT_370897 [Lophiotrema nucula]
MLPEPPSQMPLSDLAATEVLAMVTQLKQERDDWQQMALRYKEDFDIQTRQLREFQDICFATQAELENERLLRRSQSTKPDGSQECDSSYATSCRSVHPSVSTIKDSEVSVFPAPTISSDLKIIEHLFGKQQHSIVLNELDHLLRGSLSAEARVEGLLLKSALLRLAGSEWLYDALAQCSEALELCDRLSDLEAYLPKIQYQRGLCYHRLSMVSQAKAAFKAAKDSDLYSDTAFEYVQACEEVDHDTKRRSAFDERRNYSQDYLLHWKDMEAKRTKRRPTTQIIKLLPTSKTSRLSLPHRWKMTKSV